MTPDAVQHSWYSYIHNSDDKKGGESMQTDFEKFEALLSYAFNSQGIWSCEFCYWLDADDRICEVCRTLRALLYNLHEKDDHNAEGR